MTQEKSFDTPIHQVLTSVLDHCSEELDGGDKSDLESLFLIKYK